MLYTSMLSHVYLPEEFMKSFIVPLIKKRLDILVMKVITYLLSLYRLAHNCLNTCVLLGLIEVYLYTSDNQFGFKSKHSTDLCIY